MGWNLGEEKGLLIGDFIFEERLVRKYGSLNCLDPGNKYSLWVAHSDRTNFNKQRGYNKYDIFATT